MPRESRVFGNRSIGCEQLKSPYPDLAFQSVVYIIPDPSILSFLPTMEVDFGAIFGYFGPKNGSKMNFGPNKKNRRNTSKNFPNDTENPKKME